MTSKLKLRKSTPSDLLEDLNYVGLRDKNNLPPTMRKILDHYNKEHWQLKRDLFVGDENVMARFLDRSWKSNDRNYEVLYEKWIDQWDKIEGNLDELERKVRLDSQRGVPVDITKYSKNVFNKSNLKEMNSLLNRIMNTDLYLDIESDYSRVKKRRAYRQHYKDKSPYKSKYKFTEKDVDREMLEWKRGKNDRYEGQFPTSDDIPQDQWKWYYPSQQKPKISTVDKIMNNIKKY